MVRLIPLLLGAVSLASAGNAGATDKPIALTDEQLDTVVAGSELPGAIGVTAGEGAEFHYDVAPSIHPPPGIYLLGDETVLVNLKRFDQPSP